MRKMLANPQPVQLHFDGRRPVALQIKHTWRPIKRILDYWRETGRWWEGEPEREFLRVEAGGIAIIGRVRRKGNNEWRLYATDD